MTNSIQFEPSFFIDDVVLIITAAGSSRRFSAGQKLLCSLSGRSVLETTFRAFSAFRFSRVIITIPLFEDTQRLFRDHIASWAVDVKPEVVVGGATRQVSVQNALAVLDSKQTPYVMVHDAARPWVSVDLIQRVLSARFDAKGIIPGIPVVDTVKRLSDGLVVETLDRSELVRIQTPQLFDVKTLRQAISKNPTLSVTDDAMYLEKINETVKVVDGEPQNLKITIKEDLLGAPPQTPE